MSRLVPELLIVSGGSEVVGLALAEAARGASIPYAVFSLVAGSVLRNAPGCVAFADLSGELRSWNRLRDEFLKATSRLSDGREMRLAILPTEDGSLRLLNECRDDVLAFGDFPRARALRMGGVDKAEVVELLEREGVTARLASSRILDDPREAGVALEAFGADAIFKPALKPINMDLSGMGGHGVKVVTQRNVRETPDNVIARLRKAWPLSRRWIAQPRLRTGPGLERSVCAVRGKAARACQVVERAKYPRMGGTAYWVSTEQRADLVPSALGLLEALDVVGMCELSYLPDAANNGHLIEFNPRPWLQVGLVERAGFPIVVEAIAALRGRMQAPGTLHLVACDWLQPERMLLAFLSRQCTWRDFASMTHIAFRPTTVIGGYSSTLPNARRRLAVRSIRGIFSR